nr:TPA_asm: triple gene block protein 2 [Date palm-associated virus A]
MSLRPPPDYNKTIVPISIGAAIGICLYFLTRSTLPHVGDNIHSLPHGGHYRDGSKVITYCSPQRNFPASNLFKYSSNSFYALIAVIVLIFLIYVSGKFNNNRNCFICPCNANAPR